MNREGRAIARIDPSSPHGIYRYDYASGAWVEINPAEGYLEPRADGLHVIYFDNARCPACRVYDLYWFPFVSLMGQMYDNANFYVVLCEWFARNCGSEKASRTFERYDVHASPTTMILYVSGGKVVATRRLEGVKRIDQLAEELERFLEEVRRGAPRPAGAP